MFDEQSFCQRTINDSVIARFSKKIEAISLTAYKYSPSLNCVYQPSTSVLLSSRRRALQEKCPQVPDRWRFPAAQDQAASPMPWRFPSPLVNLSPVLSLRISRREMKQSPSFLYNITSQSIYPIVDIIVALFPSAPSPGRGVAILHFANKACQAG